MYSSIQTVRISSGAASTGIQSISIPSGFDRLVISNPSHPVFIAFSEADIDNEYRRFYLPITSVPLVITNPQGLGSLYILADDSSPHPPTDSFCSVMVV